MLQLPKVIQGGMGVGVYNWRLAPAVSRLGQLGVISGTALDQVLVSRLADRDEGGYMRISREWSGKLQRRRCREFADARRGLVCFVFFIFIVEEIGEAVEAELPV